MDAEHALFYIHDPLLYNVLTSFPPGYVRNATVEELESIKKALCESPNVSRQQPQNIASTNEDQDDSSEDHLEADAVDQDEDIFQFN